MMKWFLLSLLCDLLVIAWMAASELRSSGVNKPSLRRRVLSRQEAIHEQEPVRQSRFDYSASPSATATSKCALINILVNETATGEEEQTWLKESGIPSRVANYQGNGYDKVFVCGSGTGISASEPSSAYRFMGCTMVDASGVLASTEVVGWTSKTEDTTNPVEDSLSDRIRGSFEQTMASLPSSIEGIDLLETCERFDKEFLFATTEFEESLEAILDGNMKAELEDLAYDFHAYNIVAAVSG